MFFFADFLTAIAAAEGIGRKEKGRNYTPLTQLV